MKLIKTLVHTNKEQQDIIVLELHDENGNPLEGEFFQVSSFPEELEATVEAARVVCQEMLNEAYPDDEVTEKYIVYKELYMEEDVRKDNCVSVQSFDNKTVDTGDLLIYGETYPDRKAALDKFAQDLTMYINQ